MNDRVLIWALYGVLSASAAYSANIGLQLNNTCVAGSCPAQALPFNSNSNLPLSTSVTLANGDTYAIVGALSSANDGSGTSLAFTYLFQVIYQGNGRGGGAQADTITLDALASYLTASSAGTFNETLRGSFSPTIARASSVQICIVGFCTTTASPAGSFNVSRSFPMASVGGVFLWDFEFSVKFGAGSPAGSYVLFSFPSAPVPRIRPNQGAITASAFGAFPSISPGSWIEIYGADLALGSDTWTSLDFNGAKAPTSLGGTTVSIGGKAAFVDFISPGQVNAQVPSDVATGPQPLIVTTAGGSSDAYTVDVNTTRPGLLALPLFKVGGVQYVVALFPSNTYVLPPGAISGLASQRARPGDTIILYGVGFGAVNPAIPAGQIVGQNNSLAANLNISIGGTQANYSYNGLAPNYVGLYQFNVVVPDTPPNDKTPLTFNLGGAGGPQTLYVPIGN